MTPSQLPPTRRFARAIEALGDGVWDWDIPAERLTLSDSYYRLSGYEPGAFPPRFEEWSDRVHPDDRARALTAVEDALAGRTKDYHVAFRFLRSDGNYHWVLARGRVLARDVAGRPLRMSGTHTDIASLSDVERVIATQEAYLRGALDAMADAIVTLDTKGYVTGANAAALGLLQRKLRDVIDRRLHQVLELRRDDQPITDPLAEFVTAGEAGPRRQVLDLMVGDDARQVEGTCSTLRDSDGAAIGQVLVIRDVTEELIKETQLRHAQKMDSIGQLAGGVAHDFNNMLSGIMGAAELLSLEVAEGDAKRQFVDLIIETACRAGDLTEKLLAFSRKAKVLSTPIDVHEVIANALTIIRRSIDRRITIHADLAAKSTSVIGDPIQIENALINLCINARDAIDGCGEIEITTVNVDLTEEDCATSPFNLVPGEYLQISIRDDGRGMPPEILKRAFDPFYTTKEVGQGTGLGLAAVYGTILDHRGALEVSSAVGQGTVFHLSLAATTVARRPAPPPPSPPQPRRAKGRILIVDDEEVIRATACHLLRNLGYEAVEAVDGIEGFDRFQQMGPFDLVILDMVMPRMNGEDCFNRIRDLDAHVPIIISSGFTRTTSIAHLFARGLSAFVKKPYRMRELAAAVDEAIGHGISRPDGSG